MSNRDFVLDYLGAAATCATHLSQLGGGDRALVEPGVRVLRGRRRLLVGLEPHAAEEEPGRGRAAARQGAAGGVAAGRACTARSTGCRSPTTRTSRRTRSRCSTRSTPSSSASAWRARCSPGISFDRERMAARRLGRVHRRHRRGRRARARRACRSARRTGSWAALVRTAVERGKRLSELTDDELRELVPQLDGSFRELLEPAAGSSRRSRRAAPRSPACATSSRRPATCWTMRPE